MWSEAGRCGVACVGVEATRGFAADKGNGCTTDAGTAGEWRIPDPLLERIAQHDLGACEPGRSTGVARPDLWQADAGARDTPKRPRFPASCRISGRRGSRGHTGVLLSPLLVHKDQGPPALDHGSEGMVNLGRQYGSDKIAHAFNRHFRRELLAIGPGSGQARRTPRLPRSAARPRESPRRQARRDIPARPTARGGCARRC